MNGFVPELLAPAGGPEQVETALLYGADAIYLSGPDLSLRTARSGVAMEDLEAVGRRIHVHGKRYYYCLNLIAQDQDLPQVQARLEALAAMDETCRPHGLIIADPGVLRLAARLAAHLPIHVSTQANTTNAQTLALWKDLGATRANLARELDGPAIAAMAKAGALIGMETECFVHGAQCLAISGRCLLSMALNTRHANQGRCTHPCRFNYRTVLLEEAHRPGVPLWEVAATCQDGNAPETQPDGQPEEGGNGLVHSAMFSCEDLCLLPYLGWFAVHGVSAVKVEGRTRSGGALAPVLDAYATALHALRGGKQPTGAQLDELFSSATRPLGTGFFLPDRQRLWQPCSPQTKRPVVARLLGQHASGAWEIAVRGSLERHMALEFLLPGLKRPVLPSGSYRLSLPSGAFVSRLHSGQQALLHVEGDVQEINLQPGLFFRPSALSG